MYAGWEVDGRAAMERFTVTRRAVDGEPAGVGDVEAGDWTTSYVGAEAGTGSAYDVVVTRLSDVVARPLGGTCLITVVNPWQDAWTIFGPTHLDMLYVQEHLTRGRGMENRLHGGDLVALTMAIQTALTGHTKIAVPAGARS